MHKNIGFIYIFLLLIIVGCTTTNVELTENQLIPVSTANRVISTPPANAIIENTDVPATVIGEEVAEGIDSCVGDDIVRIGKSIADKFEGTSSQQVMDWFCDGADFENILVALQTQEQTEFSADDLLILVAEGYTWEEIWDLVGLTGD